MPVHVTFDIKSIKNEHESKEKGHYVGRDADFAIMHIPGDKNTIVEKEVTEDELEYWRTTAHLQHCVAAYMAWKSGMDAPVNGTAIKEWPIISPTQLQQALSLNIRTVEDFANLTDEGLRRFGVGGQVLKHKAQTWLKSAESHGKVVEDVASLQTQLLALQAQLAEANANPKAPAKGKAPATTGAKADAA